MPVAGEGDQQALQVGTFSGEMWAVQPETVVVAASCAARVQARPFSVSTSRRARRSDGSGVRST